MALAGHDVGLFGEIRLPLHLLKKNCRMNSLKLFLLALSLAVQAGASAQDYFDVMPMRCHEARGGVDFAAEVDVPVGGGEAVMREAKRWICGVLGVDEAPDADADAFGKLLERAAADYMGEVTGGKRSVKVTWSYEDPTCVTFEAEVADRDSVVWTTADVATFSKRDGHRVDASEVFACDEKQIKRLMWSARGNLPMEVSRPDDLYVGSVGFIDGWVIVVGPARGTSGAEFKIRYSDAEKWLVPGGEGYLP